MNTPDVLSIENLVKVHDGKIRRTWQVEGQPWQRIIEASNRISTHDIVHNYVPKKGEVLTALTVFWIREVLEPAGVSHHLLAAGKKIYHYLPGSPADYPEDFHLRTIVVKDVHMFPVEFIIRGYLAGSLYSKFYSKGLPNPYGIHLEPGLPLMHQFESPIFTPTEKSETDDPMNAAQVVAEYARAVTLANMVFQLTRKRLRMVGLELIDSKFELGLDRNQQLCVADEVVTPDSSRIVELSEIQVGQMPPWLDKQIARDEAERIWAGGEKYPLEFSPAIVEQLTETYLNLFSRITGQSLRAFQESELS